MTITPKMPLAAWGPLQDAANQFREECAAWEQATHDLFCDLDRLREELAHKAHELDEGRRRLAERGRQLADQRKESNRLAQLLEQQEARLAEALTELRALREQLDREREEFRQREQERNEALRSQIAELQGQVGRLQAERDELKQLLDLSRAGGDGGASPAQVVEPLLRHFAELKQEMDSTRNVLAGAIEHAVGRAAAARPDGAAGEPAQGADELARLHSMEKERLELESELELVRARAAELQETVQQQKRELAEQRAELTEELRQLRRIVEQQAGLLGQRSHVTSVHRVESHTDQRPSPAVTLTHPARENVRDSTPVAAAADPVVSSVMAQFAKLQKDVALRRKKK